MQFNLNRITQQWIVTPTYRKCRFLDLTEVSVSGHAEQSRSVSLRAFLAHSRSESCKRGSENTRSQDSERITSWVFRIEAKIKTERLGFSDFLPKSQRLETREGSTKAWPISLQKGARFLPNRAWNSCRTEFSEAEQNREKQGHEQREAESPDDFLRDWSRNSKEAEGKSEETGTKQEEEMAYWWRRRNEDENQRYFVSVLDLKN